PGFAADRERMATFLREYGQLSMYYRDFVGWDRRPFSGETITINYAGERILPGAQPGPDDAPAPRFFGGSTMWGTGAPDEGTIPALFGELRPGMRIHNHGETGFVLRQSLAELVNVYAEGGRADLLVFYDGVNDVGTLCRREISMP